MSYTYDNQKIVVFGRVEDEILDSFEIQQHVYYAEFNWDLIIRIFNNKSIQYNPVSKFPSIRRDLSLLIDHDVTFQELSDLAYNSNRDILKSVNLFDVYNGKNIPSSKKSYALSFVFSDSSKTLTDRLADKMMKKIKF